MAAMPRRFSCSSSCFVLCVRRLPGDRRLAQRSLDVHQALSLASHNASNNQGKKEALITMGNSHECLPDNVEETHRRPRHAAFLLISPLFTGKKDLFNSSMSFS
eukprot:CAMPEP_0172531804 /NCGR_PEP_ID=MMETSP1067-20121228/5061_1 /TAXON_ID=265564 ORGANISM="Thalassiosira punctigera, Strain Tpunct2005C2" /NCGR_SAMPLE_ID=MMETSP1067 /ASSEMBLY_ACC=CAM_ASM_000444 /LENGTH=103 /DNA_ID=CAMNT_0013316229 /DNA_START=158 /DNA_END=469 /DNA_ORIENTATION=+